MLISSLLVRFVCGVQHSPAISKNSDDNIGA